MRRGRRRLARWLPLAVAAATFSARELLRAPTPADAPAAVATALPMLRTGAVPSRATTYELDLHASSVRFLWRGPGGRRVFACPLAASTLRTGGDDTDHALDLRLDLGSLRALPADDAGAQEALRQLLGVHRGDEVTFAGHLVSRASTPVPGLLQFVWSGTLRFGGQAMQQDMALWQTALPGRPLRLSGHGAVNPSRYGITRTSWFGLGREQHVVTLGLDLAFRRVAAR